MKWVKASEKLPPEPGQKVIVKYYDSTNDPIVKLTVRDILLIIINTVGKHNLEWLDESQLSEGGEESKDLTAKVMFNEASFKEFGAISPSQSWVIPLMERYAKQHNLKLTECLGELVAAEEKIYQQAKDSADWFNNNTDNIGITIPYATYPSMPGWVRTAQELLNIKK